MRKNLFGHSVSRKGEILGCEGCSLDKSGGRKMIGADRLRGQRVFVWGGHPDAGEEKRGLELSGEGSSLFWKALSREGFSRASVAVQNVVRCVPRGEGGEEREVSKRELLCCAAHTEEALQKNAERARVHVVLGDVAGAQLLGKDFRKDRPVFWHAPWNAYVVLCQDPASVLRKGGEKSGEYLAWRERMRAVRSAASCPGRWGFVRSRGYKAVRTEAEFDEMEKYLRAESSRKRRVSFDVEDGVVDGRKAMLLAGFGGGGFTGEKGDWGSWEGKCFSVVLDHPQAGHGEAHARVLKDRVKKLLEDVGIKKALQNGSYDKNASREFLGARLRGYDYDTQYGTFLRYSYLRSCSLENLTYRFFPEFADYKDIVGESEGYGAMNYADVPLDDLVVRNSGDCDVTKRLEERFSPQVRQPLMEVYIHAGITLDKMEQRGPLLDWESWKAAKKIVPKMKADLDRKLQRVSGDVDFDCDSPQQVAALVYDVLKMPVTEAGRSTKKDVLEKLAAVTGNRAMELIVKRRAIGKIESTYLDGYAASARLNDGQLRTIWWLTGAVTGRLRSGKGDNAEAEGIINFQNLHGNALLQNLLVSDPDWRLAMEEE